VIGLVAEWADEGETSRERPIAPLHLHRSEDEAWYVLEGRLGFLLDGEAIEAPAGRAVIAKAGTSHAYWNAGDGRARYVVVMGPRTASLVEAIHALDPFDPARLPSLFEEHDSELLA
jgi:mannose-6-phosphate isomerase-like protein (cupin superfamily)